MCRKHEESRLLGVAKVSENEVEGLAAVAPAGRLARLVAIPKRRLVTMMPVRDVDGPVRERRLERADHGRVVHSPKPVVDAERIPKGIERSLRERFRDALAERRTSL